MREREEGEGGREKKWLQKLYYILEKNSVWTRNGKNEACLSNTRQLFFLSPEAILMYDFSVECSLAFWKTRTFIILWGREGGKCWLTMNI